MGDMQNFVGVIWEGLAKLSGPFGSHTDGPVRPFYGACFPKPDKPSLLGPIKRIIVEVVVDQPVGFDLAGQLQIERISDPESFF